MLGQHHHLGHRVEKTAAGCAKLDDDGVIVRRLDGRYALQPGREHRAGFRIRRKAQGEFRILGGKVLAIMPFGVGELERVGQLVWADLIGVRQRADDFLQLLVIGDQRFVIDAEPGEAGGRRQRIEVALEASRTDIEAAGQGGGLSLNRGARNDKSRNGCCRQQGAKRDSG